MQAARIDTMKYVKRLEESGLKHDQAMAQTQVYTEILWSVMDNSFATRNDLQKAEKRLEERLTELNEKTNERIKELTEKTNERFTEFTEKTNDRFNELNEKIQANREQIQAVEHHLDTKIERLDSKVDSLSSELSMRLGKIVVGSTSVLGVLLGLFITAIKLFG